MHPALLSILVLAKARAKRLYPLRYCPSEQRRPVPKATQPEGRERFGPSGGVARSLQVAKDMLVTRALPYGPKRSRAGRMSISTGS
jgi:hypothetical protein